MDEVDDTSRADLALFAKALRNDWPIPPAVKRRLLQVAVDLADPAVPETDPDRATPRDRIRLAAPETDPDRATPRDRIRLAALRVLVAFARTNSDQARVDLAREKFAEAKSRRPIDPDGPTEAETLREYLERAEGPGPEAGGGLRGDGP